MQHGDIVQVLAANYPGCEWSYSGDGSTLGTVTDDDGNIVSQGLVWNDPSTPAPTLDQIEAALAGIQLSAAVAAKQDEITAALSATDWWCARAVEDGVALPDDRKTYREQLRSLHAQAAAATDVDTVAAITIPDPPAPPSA